MTANSRVSSKFSGSQFKEPMNAVASSTTIDFSCVTVNAGFVSSTSIPASTSTVRAPLFWISPLWRAGFSRTRIFTLRLCAFTSALSTLRSDTLNILIRSDFAAAPIAVRIGSMVSSGITMSLRAIAPPCQRSADIRIGLGFVQTGIDSTERQKGLVATFLGNHAVLEDNDLVRGLPRMKRINPSMTRPSAGHASWIIVVGFMRHRRL